MMRLSLASLLGLNPGPTPCAQTLGPRPGPEPWAAQPHSNTLLDELTKLHDDVLPGRRYARVCVCVRAREETLRKHWGNAKGTRGGPVGNPEEPLWGT